MIHILKELHETAQILKQDSNIVHVAEGWQSEGNTGTPWLGPDVQDLTRNYIKNIISKTLFIHQ